MKTTHFTLVLILVATLSACATSGNKRLQNHTETSVSQQIIKGKTKKQEINRLFGEPDNVSFTDSGNQIWTFKFERAVPHITNFVPIVGLFSSGANVSAKELVIMLDHNDVATEYTMRETSQKVKAGIVH
jgi:outer membrane protein assembly factor BamE (lipoprotein component of BamABCDE complex)